MGCARGRREELDSFLNLTRTVRLEARLLGFTIRREALYFLVMGLLGTIVILWRAGLYS